MVLMLPGRVMDVRPPQCSKALLPRVVRVLGRVMDVRAEQYPKALLAMVSTREDSFTEASAEQP